MKRIIKLLPIALIVVLTGCVGPSASYTDRLKDSFLFTSADNVPENVHKSIVLTQPYSFQSGMINYSLPAGRYVAMKMHESGYFYYAPQAIKTQNSFLYPWQEGIYLENNANKAYVFGRSGNSFSDRPIRGSMLPQDIFRILKRS